MYIRIGITACIIMLLFVQLVPLGGGLSGRLTNSLIDLMHVPLGFILVGLFHQLLSKSIRRFKRILLSAAFVLVCSVFIEVLQPYVGRDAAWVDGMYTCLGILMFMCLVAVRSSPNATRRVLSGLCGCVCILIALWPFSRLIIDRYRIETSFPLLAGFEYEDELMRWSTNSCFLVRAPLHATQGQYAGQIIICDVTGDYPGVFLDSLVEDWSNSATIEFDAYWGIKSNRKIWIRVDDLVGMPPYSERFQVMVVLTQGMNHIQIHRNEYARTPSGRKMDLSRIARVGIFFDKAQSGDELYIDNLRLIEKDAQ